MAILTITLDTETKELKANIDGVEYSDVQEVNMYKYEDYHEDEKCSFTIYLKPVKTDSVINRTYLSSAKQDAHSQKISAGIFKSVESKVDLSNIRHWYLK